MHQDVPLAYFQGYVTEIHPDSFIAVLIDKINPEQGDLEAKLPFEDIRPCDRGLVREGAYFSWSIDRKGNKVPYEIVSVIEFDRFIVTQESIDQARAEAKERCKRLGWDAPSQ